jgi:hypothetical protein
VRPAQPLPMMMTFSISGFMVSQIRSMESGDETFRQCPEIVAWRRGAIWRLLPGAVSA